MVRAFLNRALEDVEDSSSPPPPMDADAVLLANGWEGDIDNVDTSKLQVCTSIPYKFKISMIYTGTR
jgi:hypothetical protein